MKAKIALALLASAVSAHSAVSMGFSTGTNAAEGWANSSGSKTATMVWGIIVDTLGDGFDGLSTGNPLNTTVDGGTLFGGNTTYDAGFTLSGTTALPTGQLLNVGGVASDDRLFISNTAMVLVSGDVRITALNNFSYDANMAAGDKYAIVWFDSTTVGSVVAGGSKWGAWFKDGAAVNNGLIMPADPGSYTTSAGPAGNFGADGAAGTKQANLQFVPEPSSMLLGLLGAVGLLRRRR
jgi:hypothetical protein